MMPAPRYAGEKWARLQGSALLLVLWALILLSAAIFGFAKWMQQDIVLHGEANRDLEARAMAHSGLAFALHPKVGKLTPGLEEDFGGGLGYRVKIMSEGGKLNIRWLIQDEPPDERKLNVLRTWLSTRGLDYNETSIFVDCLLDWVDKDGDTHHVNGVEEDGDYVAPNRMIESVEELAQVRGSEPLTRTPGWQDALTIHSAGPIDLMSADAEILRLLGPDLSEAIIQRLVQTRFGRDGVEGTPDDPKYATIGALEQGMGLAKGQFNRLSGLIAVNDSNVRITSEGRSGNAYRQVVVVAVKPPNGSANILSWKE